MLKQVTKRERAQHFAPPLLILHEALIVRLIGEEGSELQLAYQIFERSRAEERREERPGVYQVDLEALRDRAEGNGVGRGKEGVQLAIT